MPSDSVAGQDTQLQNLIDRGLAGDSNAQEGLLNHACDRLLRLTRQMFHNYPKLRRWENTDDVFQNAMVRLHRALREVRIESVRHFFNLAALQVRRELMNLTRHYFGPEGAAGNHHTDGIPSDNAGGAIALGATKPEDISQWTEFHSCIDKLPPEDQEIVNLLYYDGVSQEDAAKMLGVSVRTVKRRWQAAKLRLHEELSSDG